MPEIATDCSGFEADLSALIDGELAPERRAAIEAHVSACPSCGARLAELRAVDAALRSLPASTPPGDLRRRLAGRLEREAPAAAQRGLPGRAAARRARRRLGLAAAGAAVAAAALLAAYLVPGGRSPAPVVSDEALADALELEAIEDLEVIANLELLERYLESEAG